MDPHEKRSSQITKWPLVDQGNLLGEISLRKRRQYFTVESLFLSLFYRDLGFMFYFLKKLFCCLL